MELDEKQIGKIVEAVKTQNEEAVAKAVDAAFKAKTDELTEAQEEARKNDIDKLKREIFGEMKEGEKPVDLKKLNEIVEKLSEDNKKAAEPRKGSRAAFRKSLEETLDKVKEMKSEGSLGFADVEADFYDLPGQKVAATMTSAAITGAESDRLPYAENIGGLQLIAERNPFIDTIVDSGNTNSPTITYVDEANPDGDVAFIAEGIVKPLIDFEMVPAVSTAKKVAGKIKVSEEMLTDIDWMESEIRGRLRRKHDIAREAGILDGDGVGANLDGITNQASSFTAGALAASVDEANNWDVLRAAINQVVVAGDGMFYPTAIILNPSDAALMDMEKSTSDGHYIIPPFQSSNGTLIKGVPVFEKTQVAAGSFLVGDFRMSHVRNYVNFSIRVGFVDDDFELNLVTMIGESRLHHYIYSNEASAFVYDTFSNGQTALETP